MKLKLAIFIGFFTFFSKAQLTILNTGVTEEIKSISVVQGKIVVAGIKSYLTKSYDACNTLIPVILPFSPQNTSFYELSMIDTSIIYLAAHSFNNNYTIYKSQDGGNSWIQKYDTVEPFLSNTLFFDATEGITAGAGYLLLRTKNGGGSWTQDNWPLIMTISLKSYGDSILFAGGGTTSGMGDFLLSKNRGKTWYGGGAFGGNGYPKDIYFLNKDSIFVIASFGSGDGMIAKSINGGQNWVYNYIPIGNPQALQFKNANEGYVIGSNATNYGTILKTNDLGKTWSTFTTPFKANLNDMKFINDSIALVCGSNGLLFKWNIKSAVFTGLKTNYIEDELFSLYPNPSKAIVNVDLKTFNLEKGSLSIFNLIGETVYSLSDIKQKQEIDLSFLPSGIYLINLYNQNTLVSRKKLVLIN